MTTPHVIGMRKALRLHRCSLFVAVLFTAVLVILLVPGEPAEIRPVTVRPRNPATRQWPIRYLSVRLDHGWPYPYLTRFEDFRQIAPRHFPDWLSGLSWRFTAKHREFYPTDLALDLAIALGLLLCVVGFVEWRARRGLRWHQLRTIDTLALTFVVAILVALPARQQMENREFYSRQQVGSTLSPAGSAPVSGDNYQIGSSRVGPAWLRKLVGQDRLTEVQGWLPRRWTSLQITLDQVGPDLWRRLGPFPYLEKLSIAGPVSGKDVAAIARLRYLREVRLDEACLKDSDLEILSTIPRLNLLHACGDKITDRGLATLSRAPHLESLRLPGSRISRNEQIAEFAQRHGGRRVASYWHLTGFAKTAITDAGVRHLQRLPRLKEIDLSGSQLTDASLRLLTTWPLMERLLLSDTEVTEPELRAIVFRNTPASPWSPPVARPQYLEPNTAGPRVPRAYWDAVEALRTIGEIDFGRSNPFEGPPQVIGFQLGGKVKRADEVHQLDDEIAELLAQLPGLRYLELDGPLKIESEAIRQLAFISTLRRLSLGEAIDAEVALEVTACFRGARPDVTLITPLVR